MHEYAGSSCGFEHGEGEYAGEENLLLRVDDVADH